MCDLPECSSKIEKLMILKSKAKQTFASHDVHNKAVYSSGLYCLWEFQRVPGTVGVRLHSTGNFDVHRSDRLQVIQTWAGGQVVHTIKNSKSAFNCRTQKFQTGNIFLFKYEV